MSDQSTAAAPSVEAELFSELGFAGLPETDDEGKRLWLTLVQTRKDLRASRQSGAAPSTAPTGDYLVREWYARALPTSPTKQLSVAQLREIIELVTSVRATPAPPVAPTEEEALQWLMDNYGMADAEGHGPTLNLAKVAVGDDLYVFYLVGKDGERYRFSQALVKFAASRQRAGQEGK